MPSKKSATYALQVRTGQSSSSLSYLYVKAHNESQDGIQSGVFVTGLRVNFDQQFLSELFAVFGEVQQVVVHELKVTRDAAVLCDKQELHTVLRHCRHQLWWCSKTALP